MNKFIAFIFVFSLHSLVVLASPPTANNPLSGSGATKPENAGKDPSTLDRTSTSETTQWTVTDCKKIAIAALAATGFFPIIAVVPFVNYFMDKTEPLHSWDCESCSSNQAETCFINETKTGVIKPGDTPQPYRACYPSYVREDLPLSAYFNATNITTCRHVTLPRGAEHHDSYNLGLILIGPVYVGTTLLIYLGLKDLVYHQFCCGHLPGDPHCSCGWHHPKKESVSS